MSVVIMLFFCCWAISLTTAENICKIKSVQLPAVFVVWLVKRTLYLGVLAFGRFRLPMTACTLELTGPEFLILFSLWEYKWFCKQLELICIYEDESKEQTMIDQLKRVHCGMVIK